MELGIDNWRAGIKEKNTEKDDARLIKKNSIVSQVNKKKVDTD